MRDDDGLRSPLRHQFRFVVLGSALLCLASISANLVTSNFSILCMPPRSGGSGAGAAEAFLEQLGRSVLLTRVQGAEQPGQETSTGGLSKSQQTWMMWAAGLGSMLGTFPLTHALAALGARRVFSAAGLLSALATLAAPLALHLGLPFFLAVRFLQVSIMTGAVGQRAVQGLAYAADFAAIGVLCATWATLRQHALFISVLTCYSGLASSVTFVVSGYVRRFPGLICSQFHL